MEVARTVDMAGDVTTLWWDVGGVLLTNGWDRAARQEAAKVFGLEMAAFQARHDTVVQEFECGRLSLEAYLSCTVFDEPRHFSREAFAQFMYSRSRPVRDALRLLERLRKTGAYRMVMFNNESRELNRYRIEHFQLARYFDLFCCSCFLGLRKPDERLYRVALDLLQAKPDQCLLIDDRAENLQPAARLGIRTLQYRSARQLSEELARAGCLV